MIDVEMTDSGVDGGADFGMDFGGGRELNARQWVSRQVDMEWAIREVVQAARAACIEVRRWAGIGEYEEAVEVEIEERLTENGLGEWVGEAVMRFWDGEHARQFTV